METKSNVQATDDPEVLFHVCRRAYLPGDVKPAGTYWQRLVADGMSSSNDPLGEFYREQIRAAHYQGKPSRALSSFAFEVLKDAEDFRDYRNKQQPSVPPATIHRVRFVNPAAPRHRVTLTAFQMNSGVPNHQQAHDFWNGGLLYSSNIEVFAESDIVFL
jgi:hypothetical protein